jgi:hypothetical protein
MNCSENKPENKPSTCSNVHLKLGHFHDLWVPRRGMFTDTIYSNYSPEEDHHAEGVATRLLSHSLYKVDADS